MSLPTFVDPASAGISFEEARLADYQAGRLEDRTPASAASSNFPFSGPFGGVGLSWNPSLSGPGTPTREEPMSLPFYLSGTSTISFEEMRLFDCKTGRTGPTVEFDSSPPQAATSKLFANLATEPVEESTPEPYKHKPATESPDIPSDTTNWPDTISTIKN